MWRGRMHLPARWRSALPFLEPSTRTRCARWQARRHVPLCIVRAAPPLLLPATTLQLPPCGTVPYPMQQVCAMQHSSSCAGCTMATEPLCSHMTLCSGGSSGGLRVRATKRASVSAEAVATCTLAAYSARVSSLTNAFVISSETAMASPFGGRVGSLWGSSSRMLPQATDGNNRGLAGLVEVSKFPLNTARAHKCGPVQASQHRRSGAQEALCAAAQSGVAPSFECVIAC